MSITPFFTLTLITLIHKYYRTKGQRDKGTKGQKGMIQAKTIFILYVHSSTARSFFFYAEYSVKFQRIPVTYS